MGGSDDAGLGIGEQDGRTIGRQHADGQAARGRDDGVGARPLFPAPHVRGHDGRRAVHLMRRDDVPAVRNAETRARFSQTASGSSLEPRPQLRLA